MQTKISELQETLNINEESVFPLVFEGSTQKITFKTLKQVLAYFTSIEYNKTTGQFKFTRTNKVEAILSTDLQLSIKDITLANGHIKFTSHDGNVKEFDLTVPNASITKEKLSLELQKTIDDYKKRIEELEVENEEQAEQISYLDKTLVRAEASGENINIKNSAEYPISEISIDTNIKQDSREGYNKANNIVAGYGTAQNEDGSFYNTITNDWVSNQIRFDNINISSGEVLYISCDVKKVSGTYSSVLSAMIPRNSSGTALNAIEEKIERPTLDNNYKRSIFKYTFNEDANIDRLVLQVNGNENTADDVVLNFKNIMISNENKEYEQYGSMPSIEFPSEIKTPVGKQEVYVGNKNWLKIKDDFEQNGLKVTNLEDGSVKIEGTATSNGSFMISNYMKIKGQKTFSLEIVEGTIPTIWYWNKTDSNSNITLSSTNNVKTTNFNDYKELACAFTIVNGTSYSFIVKLQVEDGTVATAYTPHQSQVQDLDVGELLGTIVDKEDGDYFENRYERYIFTGNETIGFSNSNNCFIYISNFVKRNTIETEIAPILCNYLKPTTWRKRNYDEIEEETISTYSKTIGFYKFGLETVEEFKAKLTELYNNETPLEVLYELQTPTYTKLTPEQQAQWNAIKKMHTYEGVTNLYTINDNGISPILDLEYIKSLKLIQDDYENRITALEATVNTLLGGN